MLMKMRERVFAPKKSLEHPPQAVFYLVNKKLKRC